ncbi:coatomer beta subunit, putative [Entamoeba histolytica HM-1:IMSS-B]|uniref:Coatomer subunit beta n=7 Tax=Entamoeba histolytica TaxID=5759 RepID=A0A8U0WPC9_ENTH1|nr:coatomer beta subunit, putative [Entamoeba histolytica HM-1:IMSS]EMD44348.1 coatomer subunit beta2, putative [Entamoeba histolytica KU27]EMH77648.1 coatomer beta subunit, putative [Entamoeba histolytica HM-1:IMSS-B]EMS12620.1 coatomer subunit beta-2, putative [Entamoeba histolytica HM-3:IMSS]ENY60953.1 coatomer subunit beta-2, putative [Entamoeba histolytica HM-1:IMSS-A]BAE94770.1 beta1-COP [Entamoeba histolytica]|eukprot:XP_657557.1 coatomer beta subunit, putative [Entamoeba histolytica HM-1:IMSS]
MQQTYQIFNNYITFRSDEILNLLQKDDISKSEALQQLISAELDGEQHTDMLMNVISYALPSTDHTVKRLFLMYLSCIKRVDEQGKLLSELVLVINSLQNDLNYPNEYIRALTLKFILTISEKELIQPLTHAVINNINSKSPLVRKHCFSAICHIYRLYPDLVPNASKLICTAVNEESITSVKCSALRALMYVDLSAAVRYVIKKSEQISTYKEDIQLELLHLIKSVSRSTPESSTTYLSICASLIQSPSTAVSLEASLCMLVVSSSPSVVKAAIRSLIDIVVKSSDVNVKISILQRIEQQIHKTPRLMNELEIDMLRGFQCNSSYVRSKVAQIVVKCVTSKTINEVINTLRKELQREEDEQYQLAILQAIKECNNKFTCESIIPVLLDIMQTTNSISVSKEILLFVRNILLNSNNTNNKNSFILQPLYDIIHSIKTPQLLVEIIWILSRFSYTKEEVLTSFNKLYELMFNEEGKSILLEEDKSHILSGTYISSIVKLVLKGNTLFEPTKQHEITAKGLQCLLKLLKTQKGSDLIGKIRQGITCITTKNEKLTEAALAEPEIKKEVIVMKKDIIQVDDEVSFGMFNEESEIPTIAENEEKNLMTFRNIIQLSGYSDPLYVEASLELSQFDIAIDTLIVNQSQSTLQNIMIQLVPRSDGLEVIGQQQPLTLGAGEFTRVTIPVCVTGTSSGLIAGYINYDRVGREITTGSSDNHMVLNNISVEALDSIKPADISQDVFQKKWMGYEWENKIIVETDITDLVQFIEHLCKETHMNCVTPKSLFCSEIGFLSANLYATTVFGDDALANISIEINNGKISGCIRIRAKSQGVALSLGDKILMVQKQQN